MTPTPLDERPLARVERSGIEPLRWCVSIGGGPIFYSESEALCKKMADNINTAHRAACKAKVREALEMACKAVCQYCDPVIGYEPPTFDGFGWHHAQRRVVNGEGELRFAKCKAAEIRSISVSKEKKNP